LTKHEPDEPALKCHSVLDEASKVTVDSVSEMLEKNAFSVHATQINLEKMHKPKVNLVRNKTISRRSKLGKVTEKLFNLESCGEPEKPLKIDLDLYQMEDF
jgi:hypothetical protein